MTGFSKQQKKKSFGSNLTCYFTSAAPLLQQEVSAEPHHNCTCGRCQGDRCPGCISRSGHAHVSGSTWLPESCHHRRLCLWGTVQYSNVCLKGAMWKKKKKFWCSVNMYFVVALFLFLIMSLYTSKADCMMIWGPQGWALWLTSSSFPLNVSPVFRLDPSCLWQRGLWQTFNFVIQVISIHLHVNYYYLPVSNIFNLYAS